MWNRDDLEHIEGSYSLNSFPIAHERALVCRVPFCIPCTSACMYIFTIANSFTDFFGIKLAREMTDNFLPHILNVQLEV
jgi:hypothetical protein